MNVPRSSMHEASRGNSFRSAACRGGRHENCTGGRCICEHHDEPDAATPTVAAPRAGSQRAGVRNAILEILAEGPVTDVQGRCRPKIAARIPGVRPQSITNALLELDAEGLIERRLAGKRCFEIRLTGRPASEPLTPTTPAPRPADPVATPAAAGVPAPRVVDPAPTATPATADTPTPRPLTVLHGGRITTRGEQDVLDHLKAASHAYRALRDRNPIEDVRWDRDLAAIEDLILARAVRRALNEKERA